MEATVVKYALTAFKSWYIPQCVKLLILAKQALPTFIPSLQWLDFLPCLACAPL